MLFGATIFPTATAIRPAELGSELEARGFESLWVAEHSHIPASRDSPWPGGAELPQMYYATMDPFVALTAAASSTRTLKVATGIALVAQRDPIHLAKEVASLDVVSDGRFLLGIGAGWNIEEMVDHGTDPERRFGRMRETVEALKEIFSNDVAEYHGDQIDFAPMWCEPKPVQQPHPPIHVGGQWPGGLSRAIRYADGWIPIGGRGTMNVSDLMESAGHALADSGRSRDGFQITIYGAPTAAAGIAELAELGVDRAVFFLPPAGRDEILPILDSHADLMNAAR